MDPSTPPEEAFFLYAQRILEILFIGILLSCCLTTFLPMASKKRPGGGASATATASALLQDNVQAGLLMGRQIDSIVVNMQRTFADTAASIIPDDQSRKMVVLLGMCILPSIAGLVAKDQLESSDMKTIESFFFFSTSPMKKKNGHKDGWHRSDTYLIWEQLKNSFSPKDI